jgi:O-acetylhomoserine (thiol)-lyase
MDRHVAGARKVAETLAGHPAVANVANVAYTGHDLLPRGAGALVPFTLQGGPAAAGRFLAALKLVGRTDAPGGPRSYATDGGAGTVRLYVGLEDPDDLLDDIARALKLAQKGA